MNTHLRPGLRVRSRILTLEEANRMLPLLDRIVGDVRKTWSLIIERRTELEISEKERLARRDADTEAKVEELKRDLNGLIDRINGYIREVEELGCFVEEFKRGVINFPSLYLGRKVFLCWCPGDESVRYWHELDESYNERSPIRDTRDFLVNRPE
ncbi:MAG: DUF2203 domain-containing protein [Planctomycetes bacterium]|nr:DUF2203 domain-containing protein [Planctomycetota bacterium]